MTWMEAVDFCGGVDPPGAYLAEIKSESQQEFLASEAAYISSQGYYTGYWWAGGHDLDHDGTWVWLHSIQLIDEVGFTAWGPSQQPDGGLSSNCMILWHTQNYTWADVGCYGHYHAVCQYNLTL